MGYQLGIILVLVVVAILISKKFIKKDSDNDQLIYEDEMSTEELNDIDKELD
ncbi:hypothetical protein OAD83_06490 [Gammaproteobacteria bacterium]|jgi:hypothetical protein|nr:hypothetical protein [Gammaproteobacteria bacterium]MDA8674684.1 hypothetical protein [Gammaproteobacteria bacterium]MDA8865384.1 hypothetical protein [Gammaproteobacteria bacterium]MDA8867812.1 hypothetical protein [Gammaproteobacteria bacterium]MDA8890086.1 hypothetical protein [Gammaproteobacteria bacterium]|tara:strand:+ start:375 stop:530 length:156 start_codon:yes stop_codon:yes gene_type:complete